MKEPKRLYRMKSGDVSLTRSERMSKNYMPGIDREPGSFAIGYTPCKVFSQSIELRDAKMKMQPQMPPKTEFYPDDEPNEENT